MACIAHPESVDCPLASVLLQQNHWLADDAGFRVVGRLLVGQVMLVWAFGQRLRVLRLEPDQSASADERVFPRWRWCCVCVVPMNACLGCWRLWLIRPISPWRLQLWWIVMRIQLGVAQAQREHDVAWTEMRCCTLTQRPIQGSLKCASLPRRLRSFITTALWWCRC